jgi:hypothetical protein
MRNTPKEQMISAQPLRTDITKRERYVRFVPILLQKSVEMAIKP